MVEIEVGVFLLVLVGRREIKAVVSTGYMSRLSRREGVVSEEEVREWINRLDREEEGGGTPLFCRAVKLSP